MFESPNKNLPKKAHAISTTLTLPSSLKTSPGETWTQWLAISWLISSESPQARFTDLHKQDFSLLAPTSNYKVIKFLHQIGLQLWIPRTPTTHFQSTLNFQSLQKIQKDCIHPWGHKRKFGTHLDSLFSWLTSGVRCKFILSPPKKGSWTTGFEIWFANHLTTNIMFNLINLKPCISHIKFLEWNPADFSLPWSNET